MSAIDDLNASYRTRLRSDLGFVLPPGTPAQGVLYGHVVMYHGSGYHNGPHVEWFQQPGDIVRCMTRVQEWRFPAYHHSIETADTIEAHFRKHQTGKLFANSLKYMGTLQSVRHELYRVATILNIMNDGWQSYQHGFYELMARTEEFKHIEKHIARAVACNARTDQCPTISRVLRRIPLDTGTMRNGRLHTQYVDLHGLARAFNDETFLTFKDSMP